MELGWKSHVRGGGDVGGAARGARAATCLLAFCVEGQHQHPDETRKKPDLLPLRAADVDQRNGAAGRCDGAGGARTPVRELGSLPG